MSAVPVPAITATVSERLIDRALEIVSEVRQARDLPEPNVNRVYHYTTASTLCSMAQPGVGHQAWSKLWASSLAFMNDSQEFRLGHETMLSAWNDRIDVLPAGPLRQVMEAARDAISDDDLHRHALEVFAVCFCADGDLLSQWRGYGDFGKGMSLGLELQTLKRVNGHGFWVLYDSGAQQEVAARVVQELQIRLGAVVNAGNVGAVIDEVVKWMPVFLAFMYSVLKHHAFSEEQEYRILYTKPLGFQNLEPRFRARGAAIIPYVEVGFYNDMKMPLEEVIMGPGAGWPANVASLELLFQTAGFTPGRNPMRVRNSRVPLV